jgi:thiosulfate reductase cytochrome b subunit
MPERKSQTELVSEGKIQSTFFNERNYLQMNYLKQPGFLFILALLLPTMLLTGCANDDSTNPYIVEDAPGVRITAEALETMLDNNEPHTLSYSVRTS